MHVFFVYINTFSKNYFLKTKQLKLNFMVPPQAEAKGS